MGIFECRLDGATFSDPERIEDTRRHRVGLELKISCKKAGGVPARITDVRVKVPPDNNLLRSDEYDPSSSPDVTEHPVSPNVADVTAEYMMETEELDGDQLSQLRRGEPIDALCSVGASIVLYYESEDEGPGSSEFSVASTEGNLRCPMQEIR